MSFWIMNAKKFITDLHDKYKELDLSDCKGKTQAAKFLKAAIAALENANPSDDAFDSESIAGTSYDKTKINLPKFTPRHYKP